MIRSPRKGLRIFNFSPPPNGKSVNPPAILQKVYEAR